MTRRFLPARSRTAALLLALAVGAASACGTESPSDRGQGAAAAPTTGAHYDQIIAEHADFPAQSEGAASGENTVFTWRDTTWTFDREGRLVAIGDAGGGAPGGSGESPDGGAGASGSDHGGADEGGAGGPAPADEARPAPERASGPLPEKPRLGEGVPPCESNIHARQDVPHPTYGTVRVFLSTLPGGTPRGCIVASAPGGETVYLARIDVYDASALGFSNPVTDPVTGNTFLTYNPGRYDGVFVLIPTEDGFVEPADDGYDSDSRVRYYSAKHVGADSGAPAAILSEVNTCEPSCAAANYETELLEWDGYRYS